MRVDLTNMPKRAIIIAAGEGTRWDNHRGIDKHFVEVDGEQIIKRTVRLLIEAGITDIWVVGKDKRYEIEGSKLYIPKFTPEYHDADKFLSSKDLWLRNKGKTMVLYGDCYFSERAIDHIVNYNHHDWSLFCRPHDSLLTTNNGECFAQTFYPGQVNEHERALHKLIDYYNRGILDRIGGWEHYRVMADVPEELIARHVMIDHYQCIDDWTDDFDMPEFYELYIKRKAEYDEKRKG